eukprot:s598_g15.t4
MPFLLLIVPQEKRRQLRLERKKRGDAEQEAQELREQLTVLVKKAGAGRVLSAAGHLAMQGNGLTKEALKVSEKQEPATYCKQSAAAEVLQWKRLAAHREKLLQQSSRIDCHAQAFDVYRERSCAICGCLSEVWPRGLQSRAAEVGSAAETGGRSVQRDHTDVISGEARRLLRRYLDEAEKRGYGMGKEMGFRENRFDLNFDDTSDGPSKDFAKKMREYVETAVGDGFLAAILGDGYKLNAQGQNRWWVASKLSPPAQHVQVNGTYILIDPYKRTPDFPAVTVVAKQVNVDTVVNYGQMQVSTTSRIQEVKAEVSEVFENKLAVANSKIEQLSAALQHLQDAQQKTAAHSQMEVAQLRDEQQFTRQKISEVESSIATSGQSIVNNMQQMMQQTRQSLQQNMEMSMKQFVQQVNSDDGKRPRVEAPKIDAKQ